MKIGVCAPYFNRPDELRATVAAYRAQYPHLDLEFFIADDGSALPLSSPDKRNHVIRLPGKDIALNPCVPINVAVNAAINRGCDMIVLTNPEIVPAPGLLDEMLALHTNYDDYVMARCWDDQMGWLAGPDVDYAKGGRMPVPPGGHFHFLALFTPGLWARIGGFDEEYRFGQGCDDNDWLWALYTGGATFKTTEGVAKHTRSERTQWFGGFERNAARLTQKWGHLWPKL